MDQPRRRRRLLMPLPHVVQLALLATTVQAQIRIQAPQSLAGESFQRSSKAGYIVGSTATFGAPYYGMRVMGRIQYAPSKGNDFCTEDDYDVSKSESGGTAPESTSNTQQASEGTDTDRREINIVMVERGESKCRFTTKVRVAEKTKNAHAVIIIDRQRNSDRDVSKLIMSDEHNFGNTVKIPSILINWHDAQKIKTEMEKSPVIAELVWDIPLNNLVTMDIWLSASSQEAAEFLKGFKPAAEQLAYNLRVVPHYHIFSLPAGQDYEKMCMKEGQFCAEDPDGGGPITGQDVVAETLRQLCIWDITAVPDPLHPEKGDRRRSWKYWEYVTAYQDSCAINAVTVEKRFGNKACSEELMTEKGINVADVNSCETNRGTELLTMQKKNLAWSKWAVRLNGWRYSGTIEPEGIIRAICSAYTTHISECDYLTKPHSKLGNLNGNLADGMTFSSFLFLVAVALALMVLGLFIYKRFFFARYVQKALREEVMLEVQTQLADYVPLDDKSGP